MRHAARLVLMGGAVAVGLYLWRAAPRDLALVYGMPAGAPVTSMEVEVLRDGETLRRAEFRFPGGAPGAVRHAVRLPDGAYLVRVRLAAAAGPAWTVERPLEVSESGTVVLPLGPPSSSH